MSTPAARESKSGVLGVGLGLALIAVFGIYLLRQPAQPRDGEALLGEWFASVELPFGLEVEEAATLMDGRDLVKLARRDAPPEAPRKGTVEGQSIRWHELPSAAKDQPPREVVLARIPQAAAKTELERRFGPGEREGEQGLGPKGGWQVVDRSRLSWAEFEVESVYEREFEPGGTFVDHVWLNLAQPGRALVLHARWSRNEPYSREKAAELLRGFTPRP